MLIVVIKGVEVLVSFKSKIVKIVQNGEVLVRRKENNVQHNVILFVNLKLKRGKRNNKKSTKKCKKLLIISRGFIHIYFETVGINLRQSRFNSIFFYVYNL